MVKNKTSIIYMAHGPKHLHRQSIFSILTLCHFLDFNFYNLNIVVYTDDKELFEKHLKGVPVQFELLSPEIIKSYIKNNYVHRAKICVIQDCIKKYDTNILYVDGDTYFLKSPVELLNKISRECTIFHEFEFTIADGGEIHEVPMWLTLRKLAKNYEYILNGEKFKLKFDSQMWNSGILGLNKDYLHLIDDVLDLNDQLTAKAKFKTAEQFSFTYILIKHTKLVSGKEFIFHYWQAGLKQLFNYHILLLLNKNSGIDIGTKAKKAVDLYRMQDQLQLPEKTFFQRLQLRCKLIWKVAKEGHLLLLFATNVFC